MAFGSTAPTVTAPAGVLTTLGYSATPAGVCAVDPSTGALTLMGAGDCEITATAAGSSDYNEATTSYTITVETIGTLVLNLGVIASDNTVNIAEKVAGFEIGGDTGTESGVEVTVRVGTGTLTATSADDAGTAAWSVSVPADASYITGTSVDVSVSASKSDFTAPAAITRTLTVDLTAPTAPGYTAPVALKVGVAINAMNPSGGADISQYGAAGLPSGLILNTGSGVISGTPDTADADTATARVTVGDTAGNTATTTISFPAVAKGDQALTGFAVQRLLRGVRVHGPDGDRAHGRADDAGLFRDARRRVRAWTPPRARSPWWASGDLRDHRDPPRAADDYNEATASYSVTVAGRRCAGAEPQHHCR